MLLVRRVAAGESSSKALGLSTKRSFRGMTEYKGPEKALFAANLQVHCFAGIKVD